MNISTLLIERCSLDGFVAVDTSNAGMGNVDVDVTQGTLGVPVHQQSLSPEKIRFCFVPTSPRDHLINISFNSQPVPGMCAENGTLCQKVLLNTAE